MRVLVDAGLLHVIPGNGSAASGLVRFISPAQHPTGQHQTLS